MSDRTLCLDTSILIKYLTPDEQEEAATTLVLGALQDGSRLVAPAWAWAEVGSVLRTADAVLLRQLGDHKPAYVKSLPG